LKTKPCSRCGSVDIGVKDSLGNLFPSRVKTWAYCCKCGFKGPVVILIDSIDFGQLDLEIEKAITAWNTVMEGPQSMNKKPSNSETTKNGLEE